MATDELFEFVIRILHWDHALHLLPSPGGIPKEHTFQGDLIFPQSIQVEGLIEAPMSYTGRRTRIWLSGLPDKAIASLAQEVGSVEDRLSATPAELLVQLWAPENALETATVCLASTWRYLRLLARRPRGAQDMSVERFGFARGLERTAFEPHSLTGRQI